MAFFPLQDQENEDLISPAVAEALGPIAHLESDWDLPKLEKRIRQYFRNAIKNLEFGTKPWQQLIQAYADSVFASIFQALHDRTWLNQADFLLVLDAAVKELFPKHVLRGVQQHAFEKTVLGAHDRAFEEQRFAPMLWEIVQTLGLEKRPMNKVYSAFEAGRKDATVPATGPPEKQLAEYVGNWIQHSIKRLSQEAQGNPETLLQQEQALQLFQALIEAGALPLSLTADAGEPSPYWPLVEATVNKAYGGGGLDASPPVGAQVPMKGKGKGKGVLPPQSPADKRPIPSAWGTNAAGEEAAKRQRPNMTAGEKKGCKKGAHADMSGAAPAAPRRFQEQPADRSGGGHPLCTQAEDCIGGPASALFQHLDGDSPGDIYCAACWANFADTDPWLMAIPYSLR